jgi:DNA-binding NarL/FixJ family response regulator
MRIIIADDHAIFRDGLKLLLGTVPGFQVVAEAGEAAALKTLVRDHRPDLVILDYNMPGGDSGETLAYLKRRHPEMRVMVLTAERSGALLQHLADAGADGILLKEGSGEDMLAAIRGVARGSRVIPDNVRERMDGAAFHLTAREFQVLHLICDGWANAAIAERFSLSPRTVDKHRENIQRKLGVNNVVQLINKARELGLFAAAPGGAGPAP